MRCPKCSLINPDSAVMCDCGHAFDPVAAEAARAQGFRPRNETHPPGPSVAARIAVGVLGYVVGGLPLDIVMKIRPAYRWDGAALAALRVLKVLLGVLGVAIALRLLKRRCESRRG